MILLGCPARTRSINHAGGWSGSQSELLPPHAIPPLCSDPGIVPAPVARNRRDFEDIPEDTRKLLEFVWLERAEQAIEAALTGEHPLVALAGEPAETERRSSIGTFRGLRS
jgi:hypothetical protein